MTTNALPRHCLEGLTPTDRLRVSWFRVHPLSPSDSGEQTWVLETLAAMTDNPIAVDLFAFAGTFDGQGIKVATAIITHNGFRPACTWHPTCDGHTWALSSLRPDR